MNRYVDKDAFIADARMVGLDTAEKVLFALAHQPSIDIVRCAECIDNSINCDGEENWCLHLGCDVEPSDFCSYGERKP